MASVSQRSRSSQKYLEEPQNVQLLNVKKWLPNISKKSTKTPGSSSQDRLESNSSMQRFSHQKMRSYNHSMSKIEETGQPLQGDYEYHSQSNNESQGQRRTGGPGALGQNKDQIVEYGEDGSEDGKARNAVGGKDYGEESFSENLDKLKQIRKKRLQVYDRTSATTDTNWPDQSMRKSKFVASLADSARMEGNLSIQDYSDAKALQNASASDG